MRIKDLEKDYYSQQANIEREKATWDKEKNEKILELSAKSAAKLQNKCPITLD